MILLYLLLRATAILDLKAKLKKQYTLINNSAGVECFDCQQSF